MTEIEEKEIALAKEYLAYWKPQLRLDHIDFEIAIGVSGEMGNKMANCNFSPLYHRQKLMIRHPEDRTLSDKRFFRCDLEVYLVHELLHTKEFLWRDHPSAKPLDDDKWLKQLHEDSMDAIAEALVRVRRGLTRKDVG